MLSLNQRKELCLLLLESRMTFEVIGDRLYVEASKIVLQKILPKGCILINIERGWEITTKQSDTT
jgi:hypothetical protein